MAASGLTEQTNYSDMRHVTAVADYAMALKQQLESVNEHSFNTFKLRVGKYFILIFDIRPHRSTVFSFSINLFKLQS